MKRKLCFAYEGKVKRKLATKQAKEDMPEKSHKDEDIEIKGKKKTSKKLGVDERSGERSKSVEKTMMDKYKIVKKEDEIAKIRISPKVLSEMISLLSYEQQTWVIDAGFGSLLHFDLGELPQRLAFKVLEAFDNESCMLKLQNGNIKITEREVYNVLGLPYEGDEVVIAQGDARHERIIQWRAQFSSNNDPTLIKASEVVNRIKQQRNVDELFKMNFVVIITNVLIRSNTNNFLSQTILSFDDEFDNSAQYNWAAYLIKNLVITKERWMHKTSLFYTGPMIFLIILYADRVLYKGRQVVRRDNPSFRGWTKGRLREMESMESERGTFGSRAIFEAGSQERIPENQRITEDKATNSTFILKKY
ncbi:hypothetical protein POM88_006336 [Heracleum sosnowskyi]|uniref:Uncharacterized protein n=1 Tax=Heracleum sosnowskyi TaxID=360622 RepID=A0AAD8J3K1_9APIA|nr:hypothetical protein POM88_006336 [Heracleum sosnowskyi]